MLVVRLAGQPPFAAACPLLHLCSLAKLAAAQWCLLEEHFAVSGQQEMGPGADCACHELALVGSELM